MTAIYPEPPLADLAALLRLRPMLCGDLVRRYLYTHAVQDPTWSQSVWTVYSQINNPLVLEGSIVQLTNGIDSQDGNADAWVDYLSRGKQGPPAHCIPAVKGFSMSISGGEGLWHINR